MEEEVVKEPFHFKCGGVLCNHAQAYKKSFKRLKARYTDYAEIDRITTFMKIDQIDIIKYRNSFNSVKTGQEVKEGHLKLAKDGKKFDIWIKKFK